MSLPKITKKDIKRIALEADLLMFTRYFFKEVLGYKMKVSEHHKLLARALMKVYDGSITRLVINMPPGYTKTELAVVHFIAWCLAKHDKCRFLHVTYSEVLALENSSKIRDIIQSEKFQELWPMELRKDSKAKGAWKNTNGGGMQARAAGGQITGFRAGQPEDGFSGAFIVDDPLKPDDAKSMVRGDAINDRFNNVFKSRLMTEKTPIIVVMQRISANDPSAFLLDGGTAETWHHLNLPALIDNKVKTKRYKRQKRIAHKLQDGPLWEYKHNLEEIARLKTANSITYASQYDQNPTPLGGGLFKTKWFKFYKLGSIIFDYLFITADTAQKTKEINDFSVLQCWGYFEGSIYLVDQLRGKWEAPALRTNFKLFWNKHNKPASTTYRLRFAAIEDKSSGTGLIQDMSKEVNPPIPIRAIQRNVDKVTRSLDGIPYIESGKVFLPEDAKFALDYLAEFSLFSADNTHRYDDQIDPTLDAIDIALSNKNKTAGAW